MAKALKVHFPPNSNTRQTMVGRNVRARATLQIPWRHCSVLSCAQAPAKPDSNATGKPAPPAKAQKAAKPVAKPAASTSAEAKPTSAVRPGQYVPNDVPVA